MTKLKIRLESDNKTTPSDSFVQLLYSAPIAPRAASQSSLFAYQPMHDIWRESIKFNKPQNDIEQAPGYVFGCALDALARHLNTDAPIYRADIDWDSLYDSPPNGLSRNDLDAAYNIVNEMKFILGLPSETTFNIVDIISKQPDFTQRMEQHIEEHIHHTPPLIKEMNWMEEFSALATYEYAWYPIYCLSDAIYQSLRAFAIHDENITLHFCQNCGRIFFRKKQNNEYCSYGIKNNPDIPCHDEYRKLEKKLSRKVSNAKKHLGEDAYDLVYQSIKTSEADKLARQAKSKARQSCTDFKSIVAQYDLPPHIKYALRAIYIASIKQHLERTKIVPDDYSAFQDIDKLLNSGKVEEYLSNI